ncbi:hypothetical protein DFH07DRAFT_482802 [Mycena maculata]|uniref:Uncharacterized protein n=1 Tax=Mycena maculata TaxID=230809 RepID=A0AAD7J3P1_9AGAR|nr:hypothetical protein DFH07DRAFT_482802 [Mycena maculata]
MDQVLTATHDNASAWAGIGAAISYLWSQKAFPVRASLIGVLSAACYLAIIFALHITTSSVTFNSSRSFVAATRGLPAYIGTPNELDLRQYSAGSLYFLPSILNSTTNLGLLDGTLYDVLDIDPVLRTAAVDATGFNITCGYVANISSLSYLNESPTYWRPTTDDGSPESADAVYFAIFSTQPGVISSAIPWYEGYMRDSIVLYSTIPILDSIGQTGPLVKLSLPMDTSVSSVQMFQCSLSLVNQTATVDSQSHQIQSVGPDYTKTTSTSMQYIPPSTNVTADGTSFMDTWGLYYSQIPPSDFPLDFGALKPVMASVADVYLIQKLNLPAAHFNDTLNVKLHDVENALSVVVASMFWTLGHIPPTHRASIHPAWRNNGTGDGALSDLVKPPILMPGKANVTEVFTEERLELNIFALSGGLAISLILMALAFPTLLFRRGFEDTDVPIDGTGILHAIWLYRNQPELETLLKQVEHPTDENLRAGAMIRTRLVGGRLRKQTRGE